MWSVFLSTSDELAIFWYDEQIQAKVVSINFHVYVIESRFVEEKRTIRDFSVEFGVTLQ